MIVNTWLTVSDVIFAPVGSEQLNNQAQLGPAAAVTKQQKIMQ